MLGISTGVLNQKGSPALNQDIAANRPAPGFAGRLFLSTDTLIFQRDTGAAWNTITGGGTIGGGITAGLVAVGSGINTITGATMLSLLTTNNVTYNNAVPSLVTTTNISALTKNQIYWSQLGNIITCTFSGTVTGTALGPASATFYLPVASTIAGQVIGAGSVLQSGGSGQSVGLSKMISLTQFTFYFVNLSTTVCDYSFTIQYSL